MKKYLFVFVLFLGILTATAQTTSTIPFQDEIDVFIKKDSIAMPAANSILFVGSSSFNYWKDITNYFPGYPIINRGFGGSSLTDIIYFNQETIFSQYDTVNFMHWNPFQPDLSVQNPMWINQGITDYMKTQPDKDVFFFSSLLCPWIDRNLLRPLVKELPFQQRILDVADAIVRDKFNNKEFFGIHLRCTDHAKNINFDDYLNKVANAPNSKFFICSDNAEVENKFMQYPNVFKI